MNAVKQRYVGLLYAAPAILFVLVFLVYPLGQLVYTSLTSTSLLPRWISFSRRPSVSAVGFQSGAPSLRRLLG